MLRKLKSGASPAMVIAVLALIVALGGSAIAASGALTGKQKKESGKIASKVFNKRIGGASVAHAKTAQTANQADTATKANEATKAGTATSAGTATKADEATKAKTATNADLAAKANDAERLDGVAAGDYQRKLTEQCPAPESISTIDQQGNVTCNTTAVKAIHHVFGTPEQFAFSLGNGLQLLATCHDGSNTELHFQNLGATAHLSWFFGSGGATTASTGSVTVAQGAASNFGYGGIQIQGQFIWSTGEGVDTLNLHAIDNTTSCEVAGTVISAIG